MRTEKSIALIIDDEEDICFLIGNLLRQKDYEVVVAHQLSDGLKKLQEERIDLLFLDIRLPDGSGLDSLRTIRKNFPKTKIVVMSAYDGVKERTAAEREGADGFLSKPLNNEVVLKSIEKLTIKKLDKLKEG